MARCRQRDCQVDKASLPISRVRRTIDAENSTSCSFATVLPIQPGLRHGHDGSKNSVQSRWSRQGRSRRFLFFSPADSCGVGWCVLSLGQNMHQFRSHPPPVEIDCGQTDFSDAFTNTACARWGFFNWFSRQSSKRDNFRCLDFRAQGLGFQCFGFGVGFLSGLTLFFCFCTFGSGYPGTGVRWVLTGTSSVQSHPG